MEKQINFTGVNLTPYSDVSPDGQLSVCSGLERYNGSLRPVALNGTEYEVNTAGLRLIYVHRTAQFSHFIFYKDETKELYWSNESMSGMTGKGITVVNAIQSVTSVGNTLVVTGSDGIHYFYFSFDSNSYTVLEEWPEVVLNFGLQGYCKKNVTFKLSFEEIPAGQTFNTFTEKNKRTITDAVMSQVNSFISQRNTEGLFLFPFMVRYAYRLYDGSLVKHSAPVLMLCSNRGVVAFAETAADVNAAISEVDVTVAGVACNLDYQCSGASVLGDIGKWTDVIKSVDVFVSQPFYTLVPDGTCTSFEYWTNLQDMMVCKHMNRDSAYSEADYYQYWNTDTLYVRSFGEHANRTFCVNLPYKEIDADVNDCGNFYLLRSISPDDIKADGTRYLLQPESGYMENIVFKERMTDDYDSHDKLLPRFSTNYNSRLIFANIAKKLFRGFATEALFCFNGQGYVSFFPSGSTTKSELVECLVSVYIKQDGKDIIVENTTSMMFNSYTSRGTFVYFYYPNINAWKAVISIKGQNKTMKMALKPHNYLNGAYYYGGYRIRNFFDEAKPAASPDTTVNLPNKVYTSVVSNPFLFTASGINTVGTGDIVGLSPVTTAISQGQFGQFPMMVFCTDGNYAMQVNDEGLFSNVYPMKRDVCTNGASITVIDGAVIYVSSRGVMMADSAQINCMSDALDGVFDSFAQSGEITALTSKLSDVPPVEFFQTCVIAYDYAGKRLLFFSPEDDNGWIMSVTDGSWAQAQLGKVIAAINIYPYSYIQLDKNQYKIMRLDKSYVFATGEALKGYLVTRPVKLDSLQLKSMHQLILEGNFKDEQPISIYASNDGNNWLLLGKSTARRILTPGRYFKYYRFVIETSLRQNENISGIRIDYTVRPERHFR